MEQDDEQKSAIICACICTKEIGIQSVKPGRRGGGVWMPGVPYQRAKTEVVR